MSEWTLYWILKLDDIQSLMFVTAVLALIVAALAALFGLMLLTSDPDENEKRHAKRLLGMSRLFVFFMAISALVATFLPSTKQMAAIAILPPIVNSETVRIEAKELYDLAKSWLREQAGVQESQP